ncbi:MAG: M18 family aminopeptidase [Sandaracinaceae bacterium]|nr:M18 family aminopeptidase [Sandaracinaceae bacterium]
MTASDPVADLLAFIDASPTPWHAVAETVRRLEAVGYRALDERDAWSLAAGDRVYVIRGGSTVIAFEIGTEPPSEAGFRIIGAHTDSPNLRVKPRGEAGGHGVRQIAVEPYGGVLLYTWLDRDLSIAGRVVVRREGGLEPVLIRIDRPLCRVASLAIHLDRAVNEDGLRLNKQTHMAPHLALESAGDATIVSVVAEAAGVAPSAIYGHDLCLYDVVPCARGGAQSELVFAPRLDNLASCHAGLSALSSADGDVRSTRVVALYDHEEVGSQSKQGADSPFLADVLDRVARAVDPRADASQRAMTRSFLISADMAHAVHPNHADRHEPTHMPRLGAGPVIKTNVNQRYATDGESSARFLAWCEAAEVIPQHFVTRSDLGCGSTIGPISAGRLGVATVDVGNPMLSMHSCREMAGAADVAPMIAVMRAFYEERGA